MFTGDQGGVTGEFVEPGPVRTGDDGGQHFPAGRRTGAIQLGHHGLSVTFKLDLGGVAGDVLGSSYNASTGLVEFYRNGVVSSTHVTACTTYMNKAPCIGLGALNDQVTVNFGATAFYAGLPSGCLPWIWQARPSRSSIVAVSSPRPVGFIGL